MKKSRIIFLLFLVFAFSDSCFCMKPGRSKARSQKQAQTTETKREKKGFKVRYQEHIEEIPEGKKVTVFEKIKAAVKALAWKRPVIKRTEPKSSVKEGLAADTKGKSEDEKHEIEIKKLEEAKEKAKKQKKENKFNTALNKWVDSLSPAEAKAEWQKLQGKKKPLSIAEKAEEKALEKKVEEERKRIEGELEKIRVERKKIEEERKKEEVKKKEEERKKIEEKISKLNLEDLERILKEALEGEKILNLAETRIITKRIKKLQKEVRENLRINLEKQLASMKSNYSWLGKELPKTYEERSIVDQYNTINSRINVINSSGRKEFDKYVKISANRLTQQEAIDELKKINELGLEDQDKRKFKSLFKKHIRSFEKINELSMKEVDEELKKIPPIEKRSRVDTERERLLTSRQKKLKEEGAEIFREKKEKAEKKYQDSLDDALKYLNLLEENKNKPIRTKYRVLSFKLHPDKSFYQDATEVKQKEMDELYRKINGAKDDFNSANRDYENEMS